MNIEEEICFANYYQTVRTLRALKTRNDAVEFAKRNIALVEYEKEHEPKFYEEYVGVLRRFIEEEKGN